jgi:hypothetical protein
VSALEQDIDALAAGSLSLAVARYLHDHSRARWKVNRVWIDDEVKRWRKQGTDEIAHEATARLERLEQWEQAAPDEEPELYETRRIDAVHAKLNLQSARSGQFGTAAGPLADFLRNAGASVDTLQLG